MYGKAIEGYFFFSFQHSDSKQSMPRKVKAYFPGKKFIRIATYCLQKTPIFMLKTTRKIFMLQFIPLLVGKFEDKFAVRK